MKNIKQYKYIIIFALIFVGFGIYHFNTSSPEEKTVSDQINPIYFYSFAYEDENGLYAVQCPQTKDIDLELAIYTLSAYMQFEAKG